MGSLREPADCEVTPLTAKQAYRFSDIGMEGCTTTSRITLKT
jgi:hypothetical protein